MRPSFRSRPSSVDIVPTSCCVVRLRTSLGPRRRRQLACAGCRAGRRLSMVSSFSFPFGCGWRGHSRHPCLLSLAEHFDPVALFEAGLDDFRHLRLDRDLNHVPVALPFDPEKQGVLLGFHFRFLWFESGFRPEAEPFGVTCPCWLRGPCLRPCGLPRPASCFGWP